MLAIVAGRNGREALCVSWGSHLYPWSSHFMYACAPRPGGCRGRHSPRRRDPARLWTGGGYWVCRHPRSPGGPRGGASAVRSDCGALVRSGGGQGAQGVFVRVCVCVCIRACVRVCVCVCVRARAMLGTVRQIPSACFESPLVCCLLSCFRCSASRQTHAACSAIPTWRWRCSWWRCGTRRGSHRPRRSPAAGLWSTRSWCRRRRWWPLMRR